MENAEPDTYAICEFVQPGQMALNRDFELYVKGYLEAGSEKFGLFWDYEAPMTFEEKHVLWLEIPKNGTFEFCLKADSKSQTAKLLFYGQKIRTLPYETSGGFYFVLKNAGLTLNRIKVVRR